MTTGDTMDCTWLVQRLNPPYRAKPGSSNQRPTRDNPFAFGGGLRNGGLSAEAMDLLRDIFTFDYMGSAEFEFGAVPKTLTKISEQAHAGTLQASRIDIAVSEVRPHYREPKGFKPDTEAVRPVYLLCRADWVPEVEARVRAIAKEGCRYDLKEAACLDEALRPDPTPDAYRREHCGWLELDNGFMFFTDREMWQATCALFGVEVDDEAA